MNKEKFEKKVNKKYGISSQELSSKTVKEAKVLKESHKQEIKNDKKGISNLKVSDNVKNNKLGKYVLKTFGGASTGIAIAEGINFWFPSIVPNIMAFYAGTKHNEMNILEKASVILGLSSKPVYEVSHLTIIGVGALIGILTHTGYTLTKKGINHLNVKSDVKKAKKLNLKY